MLDKKAIKELLKESYSELDSAIDFHYLEEDTSTLEELQEAIQQYIYESCNIVYYSNAIKYLAENDPSLRESFELAEEMCMEVKNLNSETLATMLYQRELSNMLAEFISDAEGLAEIEEEEVKTA